MKKYEAGFIGAGNMGGALAKAACRTVGPEKVAVTCRTEESTSWAVIAKQRVKLLKTANMFFWGSNRRCYKS